VPVSGENLKLQNDMESAYYQGLCDMALENHQVPTDRRTAFLNHLDVKTWESRFLLAQVLQYISGVRDERLHDVTISSLG
jgi:hypothetical protein